jgi:hypothetical protein
MLLRRESLLQTIIIIISSSYNIYNTGENKIEKGAEREMKFFSWFTLGFSVDLSTFF